VEGAFAGPVYEGVEGGSARGLVHGHCNVLRWYIGMYTRHIRRGCCLCFGWVEGKCVPQDVCVRTVMES
jgi:hypothetical protein